MADIATLGVAVNSNQVKTATGDLKQFSAAAKAAQTSAGGMTNALNNVGFTQLSAGLKATNDNLRGVAATQAPLKAVGAQLAGMLIPANALAVGFGLAATAAVGFYDQLSNKGPTTEAILAEHDRLIKLIKQSYDSATQSAKNFFDQSKEVTTLQLMQQQLELMGKLREEAGKVISKSTTFGTIGDFFAGTKQVREELAPFEDAIFRLKEGFDKGTPAIRDFMDEIAKVGLANPALQKLAVDLIASANNAQEFAIKLQQVEAALKLLSGGALNDTEKRGLGLPKGREIKDSKDAYDRMTESIQKRIERNQIEIDTFNMTTAAAAQYRIEQELLNAALRAGKEITPELTAANQQLAQQYAAQEVQIENLQLARENMNAARDITKGLARDLMHADTRANALSNALQRVADRMLDVAFNAAFKPGGGGGGLFSGLFSMFSGGATAGTGHSGNAVLGSPSTYTSMRPVNDNMFNGAKRMHGGGMLGADEVPFIGKKGEVVGWPDQMRDAFGGGQPIIVDMKMFNDFRGADAQAVAGLSVKLSRLEQSIPEKVLSTIERARSVSPGRIR